ncbi:MAG: lytic murein transglycosylase [Congregibacter sp.]
MIRFSALSLLLLALNSHGQGFEECALGLGERARDAGVDPQLVEEVLVTLSPIERVIQLDRKQPEFLQTFGDYLNKRVTETRVERGLELLARHADFFDELLRRYGVPPRYLVAFWGLETNYGSYLGNVRTLNALATLACDARRSEFFAGEFVDALTLLEREGLSPDELQGSWAGALGHTQFMPSSYLRYAVDGDDDGRRDLLGSERDALASGANFLRSLGWTPQMRWGRRVELSEGFPYELAELGQARPLAEWSNLGVMREGGTALPVADVEASLILPSGHRGPAFIVYSNFATIMKWNQSQSYALSVGLLADRLAGAPAFKLPPAATTPLRREAIITAQTALNALGYDAGAPDGLVGRKTRAALREFQLARGLPADGYPGDDTLFALQKSAES